MQKVFVLAAGSFFANGPSVVVSAPCFAGNACYTLGILLRVPPVVENPVENVDKTMFKAKLCCGKQEYGSVFNRMLKVIHKTKRLNRLVK